MNIQEEVLARQAIERNKALVKYGEAFLEPAGHPDYDVFDYAINELIGLPRYADMMRHRLKLYKDQLSPQTYTQLARSLGAITRLMIEASCIADRLISFRQRLIVYELDLGKPEFVSEDSHGS